jgi:hypothetical protein
VRREKAAAERAFSGREVVEALGALEPVWTSSIQSSRL